MPALPAIEIDFGSDTGTRPTQAMRQAMADAVVGDEQAGEDPTVNRLCEMACELTGHEAAVYVPSGTMCNAIAYRLYCRQGDGVILDELAHPIHAEAGGPAALSGAMMITVKGDQGIFTGEQVHAAIRPYKHNRVQAKVVSVEQTSNFGGGAVWPWETMKGVSEAARERGLAMHMDGARLLNAAVASGRPAKDFAQLCDTTWIDLSKGLGCPVGAVLVGSKDLMHEAWHWKHQFGGSMRQAGIIAAAGVYAFEHHIDRLAEDHENARRLARGLAQIEGIVLDPPEIATNMVFFDASGLGISNVEMNQRLLEKGVRIGAGYGPKGLMRAVTHLDVNEAMVDKALTVVRAVANDVRPN